MHTYYACIICMNKMHACTRMKSKASRIADARKIRPCAARSDRAMTREEKGSYENAHKILLCKMCMSDKHVNWFSYIYIYIYIYIFFYLFIYLLIFFSNIFWGQKREKRNTHRPKTVQNLITSQNFQDLFMYINLNNLQKFAESACTQTCAHTLSYIYIIYE